MWIDYFNGRATRATDLLDAALALEPIALGDLILTEVLQGFRSDRDFDQANELLAKLTLVELGGKEVALAAAQNYRKMRKLGVTVRKTIDMIIAARCLRDGYILLHDDRDFDACAKHLGLRVL